MSDEDQKVEELLLDVIEKYQELEACQPTETDAVATDEINTLQSNLIGLMCSTTSTIFEGKAEAPIIKGTSYTAASREIAATAGETKAVDLKADCWIEANISSKRTKVESEKSEIPNYSSPINLNNREVQISAPIILVEKDVPGVNVVTKEIQLDRGFYKIEYSLNNLHPYCGLGLFNQSRAFKQFLVYHRRLINTPEIVYEIGHFYLEIKEPSLIAITDGKGTHRPKSFKGLITLTVHKYKTTPN